MLDNVSRAGTLAAAHSFLEHPACMQLCLRLHLRGSNTECIHTYIIDTHMEVVPGTQPVLILEEIIILCGAEFHY